MKEKIYNFLNIYKFEFFMIIVAVIIAFSAYERPEGIPERVRESQNFSTERGSHDNLDKVKKEDEKKVHFAEEVEVNRTLIALSSLFKEKVQKEEKVAEPTLSELIFGKAEGKVTLIGVTGKEDMLIALLLDHRRQIWTLRKGSKLEGGAMVVKVAPTEVVLSFQGKKKELKLYEGRQVGGLTEPFAREPRAEVLPSQPPHFETEVSPPLPEIQEPALPQDEVLPPQERFRRRPGRFPN